MVACAGQAGQQDSHVIAIVEAISFKLLLFRIVRCKLNTELLHVSVSKACGCLFKFKIEVEIEKYTLGMPIKQ
jgi:hypothetical protein